jgi:hypothetical protein
LLLQINFTDSDEEASAASGGDSDSVDEPTDANGKKGAFKKMGRAETPDGNWRKQVQFTELQHADSTVVLLIFQV